MLTVLGILLFVAGAILTFAVDRQAEGVDLQAVGWILMAGGGLSLLVAGIRTAGFTEARSNGPSASIHRSGETGRETGRATERRDRGQIVVEDRRAA